MIAKSKWYYYRKIFLTNRLSLTGMIIVVLFILIAIFGQSLAPYSPTDSDYDAILDPPSAAHIFGTDQFGRDVLCRVTAGCRTSLTIGLAVVAVSTAIGLLVGIISGYIGGNPDTLIMRAVDLLMAFPPVIIAMVLATIMGGGMQTLIIAMLISSWTGTARLARGETLSMKQSGFISITRTFGAGDAYILWHHILPNIIPTVLVSMTLSFGNIVLNTAGLSFIGIGVKPPTPEWGLIISEGREYIVSGQWWLIFFPGLAIMLTVAGLNLLGDGLRDILDPRQRR